MVDDKQTEPAPSISSPSPQKRRHSGACKKLSLVTFDPVALKYVGKHSDELDKDKYTNVGGRFNMCFKLIKSDSRLVKALLFSYGFLQCSSKNQKCNLVWTNTHLKTHTMRQLHFWQRVNHFPRSWMLTKKDQLYESINRASILYGTAWFDFIPDYFCTPLSQTTQAFLRQKCEEIAIGSDSPFIVKPADGSLGRGIYFLNSSNLIETFENDKKLMISRYIDRPLLMNGLKWDLRIYVLVTSFYPLIAYIYSDGLTRFAVHKYDREGLGAEDQADLNKHLTNYSLNKFSEDFIRNSDCMVENMGHKWTLGALLRELEKVGVDTGLLMVRVEDIVIKSLLSVQSSIAAMCRKVNVHPKSCFELFGFDILVDENLKPWLLEVNLSPSLICDAPLDSLLKVHLICNTLNIAQIPLISDSNSLNDCFMGSEESENAEVTNTNMEESGIHDSDQCSTTSMAASSTSSSVTSSSIPFSIIAIKRRGYTLQRINKMRKMEQTPKIYYSSDRITPQYLERVKCHFDKLKSEEKLKGHFNRIFPRKHTWNLYKSILEDSGQENWDEALHQLAAGFAQNGDGERQTAAMTEKDICLTHEQLMDAKQFKHRNQLDSLVKDTVLDEALREAECYKLRRYSGDVIPFPSALPKVRQSARRRTKSQVLAEEARRVKLEQRKMAAQNVNGGDGNSAGELSTTDCQMAKPPLAEVSLNVRERTVKLDG